MPFNYGDEERAQWRRQRPSSAPSPPHVGASRSVLQRHVSAQRQHQHLKQQRSLVPRSMNATPSSDGGWEEGRRSPQAAEFPSLPPPSNHVYRRWRLPETFLVSAAATERDVSGFKRVVMEMERCGYFEDALLLHQNVLLTALTRLAERYFRAREEASEQLRTSADVHHRTLVNESVVGDGMKRTQNVAFTGGSGRGSGSGSPQKQKQNLKSSTPTKDNSNNNNNNNNNSRNSSSYNNNNSKNSSNYSSWAQVEEAAKEDSLQLLSHSHEAAGTQRRGKKRGTKVNRLEDGHHEIVRGRGARGFVTISLVEDTTATELHRVVVSAVEEYVQKANLYALHLMNNTHNTFTSENHQTRSKWKNTGETKSYASPSLNASRGETIQGSSHRRTSTMTRQPNSSSSVVDDSTLQRAQNMLDVARRLVKHGALCRMFRQTDASAISRDSPPSSSSPGLSTTTGKQSSVAEVVLCDEDSECVLRSNSKTRGTFASITSDEACEIPIFPTSDFVRRVKLQCTVENNVGLLYFRMRQYPLAEECMKRALLLECSLYPKRQVIHLARTLLSGEESDAHSTAEGAIKRSVRSTLRSNRALESGIYGSDEEEIDDEQGNSYDQTPHHYPSQTTSLSSAIRISLGVTLMNLAQVQHAMSQRPKDSGVAASSSVPRGHSSPEDLRHAFATLGVAENELCKAVFTALHQAASLTSLRDVLSKFPNAREGVYFVFAVTQMRGEWLEGLGFLSDAVTVYSEATRWLRVQERLGVLQHVIRASLEEEMGLVEAGYGGSGKMFNSYTTTSAAHRGVLEATQESIEPNDVLRYCEEYPPSDTAWGLRVPSSKYELAANSSDVPEEQQEEEDAFQVQERLMEMTSHLERCHHAMLRHVSSRMTAPSSTSTSVPFLRKSIVRMNAGVSTHPYGYTQQQQRVRQVFHDSREAERQPPPTPSSVTVGTINDSWVNSGILDSHVYMPPRPASADSRPFRRSYIGSPKARNPSLHAAGNGSGCVQTNSLNDGGPLQASAASDFNVSQNSQYPYTPSVRSDQTPSRVYCPPPIPLAPAPRKEPKSNVYTLQHAAAAAAAATGKSTLPPPPLAEHFSAPDEEMKHNDSLLSGREVNPPEEENDNCDGAASEHLISVQENGEVLPAVDESINVSVLSEPHMVRAPPSESQMCEGSQTIRTATAPDSDAADAHAAIELCEAALDPRKEEVSDQNNGLANSPPPPSPPSQESTVQSVVQEQKDAVASEAAVAAAPPPPLETVSVNAITPIPKPKPDYSSLAKEINRCVCLIQGFVMSLRSTRVVTARIAALWFRSAQAILQRDASVGSVGQTHSILHTPRKEAPDSGHGKRSSSRSLNVDVHALEAEDLRDVMSEPSSARKRVVGWNSLPPGTLDQNYNSSYGYRSAREDENASTQSIPLDPLSRDSSQSYSVANAQFARFGSSPVSVPSLSLGGIVATQAVYARKTNGRCITAVALRESSSMVPHVAHNTSAHPDTANTTLSDTPDDDDAKEGHPEQQQMTPTIGHNRGQIPRPHASPNERGHGSGEAGAASSMSHLMRGPYSIASSVSSFHRASPHVSVLSDLVSLSSRHQYNTTSRTEQREDIQENGDEEEEEDEEGMDEESEEPLDEKESAAGYAEAMERLEINPDSAVDGADIYSSSDVDSFSEITRSTTKVPTDDGHQAPPRVNTTAMPVYAATNSSSHVSSAATSLTASVALERQQYQHKYYFVDSAPGSEQGSVDEGRYSEDTDLSVTPSSRGKNRLIWTHGIDALLKRGNKAENTKRASMSNTAPMLFGPSSGSHKRGTKQVLNDRTEYWKKRQARYSAMAALNSFLAEEEKEGKSGNCDHSSTETVDRQSVAVCAAIEPVSSSIAFLTTVYTSTAVLVEPLFSQGNPGILSAVRCCNSSGIPSSLENGALPFTTTTEFHPNAVIVDVRPPLVEHLVGVVVVEAPSTEESVPAAAVSGGGGGDDDDDETSDGNHEGLAHRDASVGNAMNRCDEEEEEERYPTHLDDDGDGEDALESENVEAAADRINEEDQEGEADATPDLPSTTEQRTAHPYTLFPGEFDPDAEDAEYDDDDDDSDDGEGVVSDTNSSHLVVYDTQANEADEDGFENKEAGTQVEQQEKMEDERDVQEGIEQEEEEESEEKSAPFTVYSETENLEELKQEANLQEAVVVGEEKDPAYHATHAEPKESAPTSHNGSKMENGTDLLENGEGTETIVVSTIDPSSPSPHEVPEKQSGAATQDEENNNDNNDNGNDGTDDHPTNGALIAFQLPAASEVSTGDQHDEVTVDPHSFAESKQSTFFLQTSTTSVTDISAVADPHRESDTSYATLEKFTYSHGTALNSLTGKEKEKRAPSPVSSHHSNSSSSSISSTAHSFESLKLPRKRRRCEFGSMRKIIVGDMCFYSVRRRPYHFPSHADDGSSSTSESALAATQAKRRLLTGSNGQLLPFKETAFAAKGFYTPPGTAPYVIPQTQEEEFAPWDTLKEKHGPWNHALTTSSVNHGKERLGSVELVVQSAESKGEDERSLLQNRIQRLRSTKLSYVLDLSVSSVLSFAGDATDDKKPAAEATGDDSKRKHDASSSGSAAIAQDDGSENFSTPHRHRREGIEEIELDEESADNEEEGKPASPSALPQSEDAADAKEDEEEEQEPEEEGEEENDDDDDEAGVGQDEKTEKVASTEADVNETSKETVDEKTHAASATEDDEGKVVQGENTSVDPRMESLRDLASPLENTNRSLRKSGGQTRSFHSSFSATPTSVTSSYAAVFSTAPPPTHPGDGNANGFPPTPLNNFYVNCIPPSARQGSVASARDLSASANTDRSPRAVNSPTGEAFAPPSVAYTQKNVSEDEEDTLSEQRRMNRARDSSGDTLYFATAEDGTEMRVKLTPAEVFDSLRNVKDSVLSPLYSVDRSVVENSPTGGAEKRNGRVNDSKTSIDLSFHRPSSHVHTYVNTNSTETDGTEHAQKSDHSDTNGALANVSSASRPLFVPLLAPSLIAKEGANNASFPLISSVKKDRVRYLKSTLPGSTAVQITDTQSVGESSKSTSMVRSPMKTAAEGVLGQLGLCYVTETTDGSSDVSGPQRRFSGAGVSGQHYGENSRAPDLNRTVEGAPQIVYVVPDTSPRSAEAIESSSSEDRNRTATIRANSPVEYAALWELLGDDPNWEFLRNLSNRPYWNTRVPNVGSPGDGGGSGGHADGDSALHGSLLSSGGDANGERLSYEQFAKENDDSTAASRLVSRVIHGITHSPH